MLTKIFHRTSVKRRKFLLWKTTLFVPEHMYSFSHSHLSCIFSVVPLSLVFICTLIFCLPSFSVYSAVSYSSYGKKHSWKRCSRSYVSISCSHQTIIQLNNIKLLLRTGDVSKILTNYMQFGGCSSVIRSNFSSHKYKTWLTATQMGTFITHTSS